MRHILIISAFTGGADEPRRDVALSPRSESDENAMRDALASRRIDDLIAYPAEVPVPIPAAKIGQSLASPHGQRQVAKVADPELRAKLDELREMLSGGPKAAVARVQIQPLTA